MAAGHTAAECEEWPLPHARAVDGKGQFGWRCVLVVGSLEIMCKFSGIIMFPMDTLKCKTEVGGWMWSGINQGILLDGPSYTFDMGDAQEETAGASYQEIVSRM